LPGTQKVNALGIFFLKLGSLDLKHHGNYIVSNRHECIFADTSANYRNSFNNLPSELLVLRLVELVKETNEEMECFLEVGNECLFGLLDG